jgi:hypothetical protein
MRAASDLVVLNQPAPGERNRQTLARKAYLAPLLGVCLGNSFPLNRYQRLNSLGCQTE